ncbi:MAG: DUF3501 family protein [Alphaproteobacteria bacterium]|nr:MAG: DUF3501 family protein [Alphaproteobacteria bacterium]
MPKSERTLTREDILPLEEYARIRKDRRREHIARKKRRRLAVGPHVTVIFENWDSMWYQVHEMLLAEKGGEEQIADELAAYAPLVPNGHELVATVMFEIEDPDRRERILSRLGGVEHAMAIRFDGEIVKGVPEHDVERSTDDGRASSVHFMHFPMTDEQAAKFKATQGPVIFAIDHPHYRHLAVIPPEVVEELKGDIR